MESQRGIVISDFVSAIRAGMSSSQLMEKYCLSLSGLVQALGRVLEVKAMEPRELHALLPVERQEITLYEQRRMSRHFIHDRVLVCDIKDPGVEGTIQNINEEGFQVKGIRSHVEETRNFLILSDDIFAVRSFAVEAECRWTQPGPSITEAISGYHINTVSEKARTELRKLVVAVALNRSTEYSPLMIAEVDEPPRDSDDTFALIEKPDERPVLTADVTESGSFNLRMGVEAFTAATNGFAMPCFLIDESYHIVFANEFAETLGMQEDRFAGVPFPTFSLISPIASNPPWIRPSREDYS